MNFLVLIGYKYGTNTVQIWYKHGTNMAQIRHSYGTNMVHTWQYYTSYRELPAVLRCHRRFEEPERRGAVNIHRISDGARIHGTVRV